MRTIRILNRDRELLAVLTNWTSWRAVRRLNEATEITIAVARRDIESVVPRGQTLVSFLSPSQPVALQLPADPLVQQPYDPNQYAQVACRLEIWDGNTRRYTGRLIRRTIEETTVELQCMTEEILLEHARTPAQWGRVYRNWDLADVGRDVVKPWYILRVTDGSQWQGAQVIESYRVDVTTEPGVVMLAKQPDGRYYSDGYITLRFQSSSVPGFVAWDRIRWAADYDDTVQTTMQYRCDGGAWSAPIVGGEPDTLGVVPSSATAATIDVRINLHTEDTETPDQNDVPTGVTPFVYAVELVARQAALLDTSTVPASTGVLIPEPQADGITSLQLLRDVCESVGWEFEVEDGKLYLAEKLGQDRTNEFVLRTGTNCVITTLGDRDQPGEWGNVLTALGTGSGIDRPMVILRDEASIAEYGEVPVVQEFEAETLAELQAKAQEWLNDHARPLSDFAVRVTFPDGRWPEFGPGDTVRVVDPRSKTIATARIMEDDRSEEAGGPLNVEFRLNVPRRSLVDRLLRTQPAKSAPRPENVRAIGEAQGIRLSWKGQPPFAVQRADTFDVAGNPTDPRLLATNLQEPAFTDGPLPLGSRHAYRVRSLANAGSDWSDWVVAEARDVTPSAAPSGVTARGIIRGIAVTWSQPPDPDYDRTEVHISATNGFTPDRTNWTTLKARVKGTAYEWTDGAVAGTTYYIRLVHVDTSGNASEASEQVSAVAGKVDLADIKFQAIASALIVQKQEANIITTTSTSYAELADMTIGPISLQAGDRVLEYFKGSTWTTADGYSSDCRFWRSDGSTSNETRHTSAYANATGQVMLIWTWEITMAGSYTFQVQWKTTINQVGKYSGMASRTHQIIILRGG